jgi:hypothetical protein
MKWTQEKIMIWTALFLSMSLATFFVFSFRGQISDKKMSWYSHSTWDSSLSPWDATMRSDDTGSQSWHLHIMFFWDLMYDRGVYTKLSWEDSLLRHFSYRFEDSVNFSGTKTSFSTLAKNFDFVAFNLETPIGKYIIQSKDGKKTTKKKVCPSTGKSIAFCSYADIILMIKKLWFTMVNLANNHTLDAWVKVHQDTIKLLDQYGIRYFGYIRQWKYFEKNYVYTWERNWILFARHGYDFSLNHALADKYCASLQTYKALWYTNFVSVHRWSEYSGIHNSRQESQAKSLIDCGADMIIGHHPHVIQDIGYYWDKLIVYSLWNFLFDQYFSEATKIGWYALIDYDHKKTRPSLSTGTIDAYAD